MPLTSIDLSENRLWKSSFAKDWNWLDGRVLRSTLQHLNLSQNNVSIDIRPSQCTQLRERSISACLFPFQLIYFPYKLVKLSNLTELKLKNNRLTRIPFAIRRMRSLRNLSLADNRFDSLPNSVTCMRFDTFDVSGSEMFAKKMLTAQLVDRSTDALRQPKSLLYLAANVVIRKKCVHTC